MIQIAVNAGFCFGVKRASRVLEDLLNKSPSSTKIYTFGDLIHNPIYLSRLEKFGIQSVNYDAISDIAKSTDDSHSAILLLRTHGIVKELENEILSLTAIYPNFKVLDMTCPFVKRIQNIASAETNENTFFLLLGSSNHPEVQSILSYANGDKIALSTAIDVEIFLKSNKINQKTLIVASQTTQNQEEWKKTRKIIENLCTNAIFFDTICDVTEKRQAEARKMAESSDQMIVIGGKNSSNTAQLYHICKSACSKTFWIESAEELSSVPYSNGVVSITAGASTPVDIIMEVHKKMSTNEEIMSFEELLDGSLKSLHTGEVVSGIVTEISEQGVYLDLGAKVTGFIAAEQVSADYPAVQPRDVLKIGDETKVFVIHVDDKSGIATLSKKRVDKDQNWFSFVENCQVGTILEGTVKAAVKGGVIVEIGDQQAFVPASHSGLPRNAELSSLVGSVQKIKIIEVNEQRKRVTASIRLAKSEAKKAEMTALWSSLSVGQHFTGKVKNLTSYGAFVDIGGVDGMVHNSELSWKRIKHPSQVVSVGDEIEVFIKEIDVDKKRISLGYKTDAMDKWAMFIQNHHVGDVIEAKITSMMPFGAFAEVYEDVEGLIHISRISMEKIAKPEDVLSIGQVVQVKITEIDHDNRKLSLSIRALLEEAARAEAEAQRAAERAAAEEAAREERARIEQERAEMAPYIVGSID